MNYDLPWKFGSWMSASFCGIWSNYLSLNVTADSLARTWYAPEVGVISRKKLAAAEVCLYAACLSDSVALYSQVFTRITCGTVKTLASKWPDTTYMVKCRSPSWCDACAVSTLIRAKGRCKMYLGEKCISHGRQKSCYNLSTTLGCSMICNRHKARRHGYGDTYHLERMQNQYQCKGAD